MRRPDAWRPERRRAIPLAPRVPGVEEVEEAGEAEAEGGAVAEESDLGGRGHRRGGRDATEC